MYLYQTDRFCVLVDKSSIFCMTQIIYKWTDEQTSKIYLPNAILYILRGGLAYLNVFIKQSKDFSMNNKVNFCL